MEHKEVIKTADIVAVIGQYVPLKKQSGDYVGKCPFHKDSTPSFKVSPSKRIYKCFGCGEQGDVVDFLTKFKRITFKQAVEEISNSPQAPVLNWAPPQNEFSYPEPDAPLPSFIHRTYGHPQEIYSFFSIDNKIIAYSGRYIDQDGKKQVLPITYRTSGQWQFRGFDNNRPMYGLQTLGYYPDSTVYVFEGEKTNNAAMANLAAACLAWHGGARVTEKIDLTVLYGKKRVVLVPDNDYKHTDRKTGQLLPWNEQPGNMAMLSIYNQIKDYVDDVKWIQYPEGLPCGWDVADKEWAPNELQQFLDANMVDVPVLHAPQTIEQPQQQAGYIPFTFLGFKKDGNFPAYCFLSGTSKTVITMSASSITKQSILTLAPINYWEEFCGSQKLDMDKIAEYLIQTSVRAGVFSDNKIRGRGAWVDKGRSVLHSGDHLIVDGQRVELGNFDSDYIYERAFPLGIKLGKPTPAHISGQLIDLLSLVNWERGVNAYLLAGWCVIAPICGALKWRPHIWITGPASSGKTWVSSNVVRVMLGQTAISPQGSTTESAIRNALGYDARPVVFDEADAEDQQAQQRLANMMEYVRACSSDNGGDIMKGVAGGGRVNSYHARGIFAFSSIGMHIVQQSDRSRITILGVKKRSEHENREVFKKITTIYDQLITEEFVQGVQARTLSMLPTIIHNTRVFNLACTQVLGGQRHGDQLGSMLAGAYSLKFDGTISLEDAVKWVSSKEWTDERALDETKDEIRLFSRIMEEVVQVEGEHSKLERSVSELCIIAMADTSSYEVGMYAATARLLRMGIKLKNNYIIIANRHEGIKKVLRGTPWGSDNHGKILERIEGAKPFDAERFGGSTSRGVGIPFSMIK